MKRVLFVLLVLTLLTIPVSAIDFNFTPSGLGGYNYSEPYYITPGTYTKGATLTVITTANHQDFCNHISFPSASTQIDIRDYQGTGWQTGGISANDNYAAGNRKANYTVGFVYCGNGWNAAKVWFSTGYATHTTANFTASPTSGAAPLYVIFTDTSTNTTSSSVYNWSISPVYGIVASGLTSKDATASFSQPGNYTITHGVSGLFNSDIKTRTDYITVYNATTDYITTGFAAMDEPRWVQLAGSSIRLHDVENNTWKNVTSSVTGYEEITTLSNHTINAYASLAGYGDADLLAKPAWNGGVYQILMYPTGYGNVSAGNITLYVNVWADSARLSGATVNIAYADGGDQINNYATTGSGGTATFIVPNKTTIYIYGEKVGYSRAGTTVYSGTGNGGSSSVSADVTLVKNSVTPTATVTTLPGGGTPTPTVTILPYCDKSKSDYDESKCRSSHGNYSLNILAEYMDDLVMLCIFVTIMYLLGFKLGR